MNNEHNQKTEKFEQPEQEDYYEIIPSESVENTEEAHTQGTNNSGGLAPNVSGLLAYLAGFISGIIFLLVEKENKFVRFHAWQSIVLSIAIAIVWVLVGIADFILAYIPILGWIIGLLISAGFGLITFIIWIFMMVRAYQGHETSIPLIGNIARNLTEK